MADERSHISWSFLFALGYCGAAFLFARIGLEVVILGVFFLFIGSVIPNIDTTDDGITGELSGLFGALFPVLLLQLFPKFAQSGSVRIALTIVIGYLLARFVFTYASRNLFSPRGALHSIPAILLFSEMVFLLFPDLPLKDRIFLSGGMGVGVFSHLMLDSFTNFSLVKKTMAPGAKSGSVMKFSGKTPRGTWSLYILIVILSWFVAQDIRPELRMRAPVTVDE